ncbi:Trp operon repressor [Methanofollis sp. W23]|uniref:hypothetical protein n=1 Tax=Methanofollis sp. W23 TaxID=2817849 RepID=UPI001AE16670|nr:hypothetical protein [Methanofollis sp. W23]MBP2147211.1 Trp operon repressor [Methanofollis sp. W23]
MNEKSFEDLDEEIAILKAEREALLARVRQIDEAIRVAETQKEWQQETQWVYT